MISKVLFSAGLLVSLTSAGPIKKRGATGQAVYWGTGDNNGYEQSLSHYCTTSQGISIVVLSFLDSYGAGVTPNGQIDACTIDTSGNGQNCEQLSSDIQTCQSNGIRVFLSIGGGGASGTVTGEDDATGIAWSLWNSYANPAVTSSDAPRPFGDVFVNGWDFDVESGGSGNGYYKDLINALRGYFGDDTDNTYGISGAPQCPLPEVNMGDMIANSQFDYLFVQFYNNQGYGCDAGDSGFNFDDWYNNIQGGASADASLYIGLPANSDASGYGEDWQSPVALQGLLGEYQSHAGFGGVMLWDAAFSDEATQDGCTYSQEVASILTSGNTC